jgi:hypothetical protein
MISVIVQSPCQIEPYIYPNQYFAFAKNYFVEANSFFAKANRIKDKRKDEAYHKHFHQREGEEGGEDR